MSDQQSGDRRESSPTARLAAANRMREALRNRAGLLPVSEAAAEFFAVTFEADVCAITLLRGTEYRKLTTYGHESPGQVRHEVWEPYAATIYPQLTEVLKAGRGYVASVGNDGGIAETQTLLQKLRKGSCIGAPIVHHANVIGEVFLSRVPGRHSFTGKELALALELSRQLGFRLGPAIIAYDTNNPDWWPVKE